MASRRAPGVTTAAVRALVAYLRTHASREAAAVRARDLVRLGLGTSDRHLRALAHAATRDGHPVGTSDRGYFYATSAGDADKTISRLEHQARQMLARARRLRALTRPAESREGALTPSLF